MRVHSLFNIGLVFFAITASLTHPQTATKPVNDADFMARNRADLIASLRLRPLGARTETERQIGLILNSLPLKLTRIPEVWVCEGCGTSSHPDVGIIVDLAQLEKFRQQFHVQNFQALLTFVIAHEAAHQMQFAQYNHDLFRLPVAVREYYEAQADILAGICLSEYGKNLGVRQDAHSLNEALKAVYNLGGEEYALADHPSRSRRFFAARAGLLYASASFNGGSISNSDVKRIEHRLDLHPGDDELSFSLRLARRIVEFDPTATPDLVELDDHVIWDKNSDHPYAKYKATYQNRGSKTLRVTIQIQTTSTLRDDPDNLFSAIQSDANNITFTVSPGQKQTVEGQLVWEASRDFYPRINLPPDPLALVEVSYLDGPERPTENGAYSRSGMAIADIPTGERSNLEYIFAKFIRASRNGFIDLRGGIGEVETDQIAYPCNTPIPGSVSDQVIFTTREKDHSAHIRSIILRTLDEGEARTNDEREVAIVRAALQSVHVPGVNGIWKESSDNDVLGRDQDWQLGDFIVSVRQYEERFSTGRDNEVKYHEVEVGFSYSARNSSY